MQIALKDFVNKNTFLRSLEHFGGIFFQNISFLEHKILKYIEHMENLLLGIY